MAAMLQITDVPTTVHALLLERANAHGQSLQEFLLDVLTREARWPSRDEYDPADSR